MPLNSKKANELDAFIKQHGSCLRGRQKVEIGGKIKALESYMIPWNMLSFNPANGRFNIEIQEYELNKGRKLDAMDKEDESIIRKLLLFQSINSDENELDELNGAGKKLYDDLLLVGEQREVAHITHDGIVVNGNRRMAALQLLHKKQGTGKWEGLWVVRLPEDISEKDLWKIEAGLQLSKEKVADYGPVHNLLMIAEGKKAGLNALEIAASMYGWTETQVKDDLERLNLIDVFLQFFGQPGNYGLINKRGLHEHFIDLQKGLVKKSKDLGWSKRALTQSLETVFVFLKATIDKPNKIKITHWDVRDICKIIQDDKASYALTDSFNKYKDVKQIPVETLVDNLDRATDIKKNKEDQQKPGKLIERAMAALTGVDRKGQHYRQDEDVKKKLMALDSLVKEMKTELGIK
jgi:hypothetical protein